MNTHACHSEIRGLGVLLVLASIAACACSSAAGTETDPQTGVHANDVVCTESRTPIALDAVSILGIRPEVLSDLAAGTHTAELLWVKSGMHSDLSVIIDGASATAVLVKRTPTVDGTPPSLCPDVIELTMPVHFASSDGGFSEYWPAVVFKYSSGTAETELTAQVSFQEASGSFAPSVAEGSCLVDIVVFLSLRNDYFGGDIIHNAVTPCAPSGPSSSVYDTWDASWSRVL